MADKERTITDRVRQAVNSPTGQRITQGLDAFSGASGTRELIDAAQRAYKKRTKNRGKNERSSSRR
jgi:pyrroline-5-carboxylate reductase